MSVGMVKGCTGNLLAGMGSTRRCWLAPRSSDSCVRIVRSHIRDAVLAAASNGKTDCLLYGSLHGGKLQTLNETTSPVVGLDYCMRYGEVFCISEAGHIWRCDLREGAVGISTTADSYGLNSERCVSAAAVSTNGYHLAIASQISETSVKKRKQRKVRRELDESGSDDEDSEDPLYMIHLLDIRKMNGIMHNYPDFHSDTIQALNFSGDNPSLLISGGADGLVNFINCTAADKQEELESTQPVLSSVDRLGFLAGSRAYATTDDGRYAIFKIISETDVDVLFRRKSDTEEEFLVDVMDSASPNSFFVLESGSQGEASLSCVFNDRKAELIDAFNDHKDLIRCCAYDVVQNVLLTGGDDGQIVCRQLSEYATKLNYTAGHVIKKNKSTKKRKPY